ncbi:MAG: hypothetical protein ABFE01_14935 [Phycisphaerales bacterium]
MQAVIRIVSMVVAAVVIVGGVAGGFEGQDEGQVIGVNRTPTVALGQPVLRENFDDNERNGIWRTYAEDSANCTLEETNQRLELRTTSFAAGGSAMYVSNSLRFDPNADFSMKVDLEYIPVTYAKGWVGFGLTLDAENPRQQQIGIGIGASDLGAYFWYTTIDKISSDTTKAARSSNSATMYMSYNAQADELYVGGSGYGADHAWMMFPGLLKGEWGGKPLYVWLGGGADGLSLASGQAFLDNLLIENGQLLEASLRDVHRFWSPKTGKHFYTIDSNEKEWLLKQCSQVWTYEGVAFAAFCDNSDPLTRPVYRFWSDKFAGHFYTIDEQEKATLIKEQSKVWTFEGVAFYVYPSGLQPEMTCPVYRLWSTLNGDYLYTIDEAEKENAIAKRPKTWNYEGVAWYALR